MREKRDEIIILRTTKAEKNRIYEKMLGMGIRSLSAYIRKMALDGYCLNLDLPQSCGAIPHINDQVGRHGRCGINISKNL